MAMKNFGGKRLSPDAFQAKSISDPILTPTAHPISNRHAHPSPHRCTRTLLKLSKHQTSHTPCPQRVRLKYTPSRILTNTHSCNTHWMKASLQTAPYTATSRSELQWVFQTVLQLRELITVSKIKFYRQPWHTRTHMNKHSHTYVRTYSMGPVLWDH